MIFLVAKMFVYLLLAGGIGFAAGWLLRNLQAQQSEERAQRTVHDVKAKLPQLESLLRGRDEQIVRLQAEIRERRQEHKDATAALGKVQNELQAEQQKTARLENSQGAGPAGDNLLEDLEAFDLETSDDVETAPTGSSSKEINALQARNAALTRSLEETEQKLRDAQARAASAEAEADKAAAKLQDALAEAKQATTQAREADREMRAARQQAQEAETRAAVGQPAGQPAVTESADAQTQQHVQQLEASAATALAELERHKDMIAELERERDLQNKSLKVMHQQLQLERSKRLANG